MEVFEEGVPDVAVPDLEKLQDDLQHVSLEQVFTQNAPWDCREEGRKEGGRGREEGGKEGGGWKRKGKRVEEEGKKGGGGWKRK